MKLIIGFSKPKNKIFPIFSWLIRLVDCTPYSHVYVRWHSRGANADIAYEAGGTSIHFLCKEVFEKKITPIKEYEIEITRETYMKLLHFCMTNAAKDYGTLQIFGIALQRLFKLNKNPLSKGRSAQVCSELVGSMLEDVIGEDIPIDLDIAGPKHIDDYLRDNKDKFKRIL